MAKRTKKRRTHRRRPGVALDASRRERGQRSPASLVDRFLHLQMPDERPWKFLLPVLALAFAVRATIALCGDFVLHPDEVMQYLEPAHRLVFGSGVTYWEFFYGARSWLVPGMVAGVLKVFDVVGLGEPFWYVGGVKLVFCAISLLIPVGMYFFARRHFGELSARVALLAGAFWYELVGFAHKPMTEFVGTALLMALLVLCVRSSVHRVRTVWVVALVAVLVVAVRLQYAPIALLVLGVFYFRTEKKVHLAVATGAFLLAVGVFDAMMWDGGLFHSYITNIRFNLIVGQGRAGETPGYQFLWWLLLASVGLGALCVVIALRDLRRYGFVLAMVALVLLIHSVQAHKEYRFVFAVVPLWLLVGADVVARFGGPVRVWGLVGVLFAAVSIGGVLNALPSQDQVYRAFSRETGKVGFIRGQDPIFAAYHYLARAPGVLGVWQADRRYFNLPGYYYLHREIPFYDAFSGRAINKGVEITAASVSHIVAADTSLTNPIPGYTVEKEFGDIQIWCRDENDAPIRQWEVYSPITVDILEQQIMMRVDPNAPKPPPDLGIRFAAESR
ncbi:MAG: hypothetical protein OXG87_06625 [Gemmatimonadetes bacterium]|nr:hypothetical protein [Gemmatimonadota bacterium]